MSLHVAVQNLADIGTPRIDGDAGHPDPVGLQMALRFFALADDGVRLFVKDRQHAHWN